MSGESDFNSFLRKFPVFEDAEHNKMRCTLTGHELPRRVEDVKRYTSTKKFLTAFKVYSTLKDHEGIFEDIGNNLLGCTLTKTVVSKDPACILRHLEGRKFQRAKQRPESSNREVVVANGEVDEDEDNKMPWDEEDGEESGDLDESEEELDEAGNRDISNEYPELKDPLSTEDSYDFSVMDTDVAQEEEKGETKRKRKILKAADEVDSSVRKRRKTKK